MRFDYMSDLHLEAQEFSLPFRRGDVLILAGDLCHASCFAADATDEYSAAQRARVLPVVRRALSNYRHVLAVVGCHDHYHGFIDQTAGLLRDHLPGVTVLDDEAVKIDGVTFYGTTLWSDFDGGDEETLWAAGKGCGEFFYVKMRNADGTERRFRPEDALEAHGRALEALKGFLATADTAKTVIITHHAPTRAGLNPIFMGCHKDGAYVSDLDDLVAASGVPFWVHGRTHTIRQHRIGQTMVLTNCRGNDSTDPATRDFFPRAGFEI